MLVALAFIAVNVVLWLRQRVPHTVMLMLSADAWRVGNVLLALWLAKFDIAQRGRQ